MGEKVWVVYNGFYADDGVLGVFATDGTALQVAARKAGSYKVWVEVFRLDVSGYLDAFAVWADGHIDRS